MPNLVHESTGLRIIKNDINQFAVVTLHYTADPAKRSEEWKKEARAGMIPAKWAKEYEIDYTALFGERVFPEITSNRQNIIVGEPYPEFGETQSYWGGFDYGGRNPSSFHVYTIHDSTIYSVWELFEPCKNIPEFVARMKECPQYSSIRYIAADPSMWNRTQQTKMGGLTSIANLFIEAGERKLLRGNHDEQAWIAMMREHWSNADAPTFKIFAACANQIREFESAIFASMNERQLMSQNYREDIVDHNNHSLDDCKYFMNSRPRLQQKNIKYPTMVRRWLK